MTIIDLDAIVDKLTAAGVDAYVEQTGGGCATIFAGPKDFPSPWDDGATRTYRVAAGPGWFDGPGFSLGHADSADFYVGPNDDGTLEPWPAMGATEDEIVNVIVEEVARNRQPVHPLQKDPS